MAECAYDKIRKAYSTEYESSAIYRDGDPSPSPFREIDSSMSLEVYEPPAASDGSIELSIVMPCLNEAETLAVCIGKAQDFLAQSGISGEVIIADNGSTDGSQAIAEHFGARVVPIEQKGYGSALMGGILASRGRYVVMGDADDSYDFSSLGAFVGALRDGAELVMGNRFAGGIAPGAMPIHHRYLGNPVLSGLGNLFFRSPSKDFHCGLRAFDKTSILALHLQTSGMEFASEMVVKATLHGLHIVEVPTTLAKDGRSRPPHLRSFRDGWRHLRFLLVYSPRWLFLYPGIALTFLGLALIIALLPGPRIISASITLDANTMLYGGVFISVGVQCVLFSLITKIFGSNSGLLPVDRRLTRVLAIATLERSISFGALLVVLGLVGSTIAFAHWGEASFGPMNASRLARLTVPSVTSLAVGMQIIFASFFISVLQIGQIGQRPYERRSR